jgi:hypothetical protein
MHLHLSQTIALANLAPSTLDVETETGRAKASASGFRKLGVKIAEKREEAGVRCRVRARRAAQGCLVHGDHPIQKLHPFQEKPFPDTARRSEAGPGPAREPVGEGRIQGVQHERALS